MEPALSDPSPLAGVATRGDVALMAGYHSPQLDVRVRLNTNEAPEEPPPGFAESLAAAIPGLRLNRYPDRRAEALRGAIGALHGVGPEQVYCANGSNEVIQSLLLAYGGPGRAAAVFEPTYALYSHIARVTGTGVIVAERDLQFLIDDAGLERVLREGGALGPGEPVVTFLCSPNNPTGRLEPAERVEAVLGVAPGLVVVDEAYGQFAANSALELAGAHPRLVVVRTFSKTWSLAGLRLGYAVAAPDVVEALFHVTLPYHLDSLKQAAGLVALRDLDAMHRRVADLVAERERVVRELAKLPLEVYRSDANFVLVKVLEHDAVRVWTDLVGASVLVRDVSSWPRLVGCLRITIGSPKENDALLDALAAALG